MTKFKLGLVIFIVGVSVIFSEAVDPSGNQFNAPQILESIILHGSSIQKPETSILTARISNNVGQFKDNSNLELLGGYRPLFPPYFPLKTPFASKKVYFDQEYYTRGTDEILLDNEGHNSQNVASLPQPVVPLIQNTEVLINNKNARFYEKISRSGRIHSSASTSRNIQYLPSVIAAQPNIHNNNKPQVTFITYS